MACSGPSDCRGISAGTSYPYQLAGQQQPCWANLPKLSWLQVLGYASETSWPACRLVSRELRTLCNEAVTWSKPSSCRSIERLALFPNLEVLDLTAAPHVPYIQLQTVWTITSLTELMLPSVISTSMVAADACWVASMAQLTKLQRLRLMQVSLPEEWQLLLSGLQHLSSLSCRSLTDGGFSALVQLSSLRRLDLTRSYITDACASTLGSLTALEHLWLVFLDVFDRGFLEHLCLAQCGNLGDGSLRAIPRLTNLRSLNLCSFRVGSDEGLEAVLGMTCLTALVLEGMSVCHTSATTLHDLRKLSNLRQLHLGDVSMPHRCWYFLFSALPFLTELEELCLSFCDALTEQSIVPLSQLTRLSSLDISGCDKLQQAATGRVLATLTRMQRLKLAWCKHVCDETLAVVAQLTQLTHLNVGRCVSISIAGLRTLTSLQGLQVLDLHKCPCISPACLPLLARWQQLVELNLFGTALEVSATLQAVTALSQLRLLSLRNCPWDPAAAAPQGLHRLTSLQQLDLSGTSITDRMLEWLGPLRGLQRLRLALCGDITDAGLAMLCVLRRLGVLDITSCRQLKSAGVRSFVAASRSLRVLHVVPNLAPSTLHADFPDIVFNNEDLQPLMM